MANKNTNPGISETTDSGVMHNPQSSRARTRTRVISPTGILKESLTVLPGAHARVREGSADFTAWRVKTSDDTFFGEIRGKCDEAGSVLDTAAGVTAKVTFTDGTVVTHDAAIADA